jgi:hypothetical protein
VASGELRRALDARGVRARLEARRASRRLFAAMPRMTRRAFLLSSAALPLGCALRSGGAAATKPVRAPAVGQSWRYAKLSGYSGKLIEHQIDEVASIGATVEIKSRSEQPENSKKRSWLAQELGAGQAKPAALPGEVQQPWGEVLVDPHWEQVQAYESPIPLWPRELRPGWSSIFTTNYRTQPNDEGRWWQQDMKAHAWESVSVPAGRFTALRFTNLINFRDADPGRRDCVRKETVWFAPEIGRWVIRDSSGTYYYTNSYDDTQAAESAFRWELASFT